MARGPRTCDPLGRLSGFDETACVLFAGLLLCACSDRDSLVQRALGHTTLFGGTGREISGRAPADLSLPAVQPRSLGVPGVFSVLHMPDDLLMDRRV